VPPTGEPTQIGRYKVLRKLGKGGMGAVYLATDPQLERQVALKVPHFTPQDGPDVLTRFYREARAAATLQHANICPVYDVGESNGTHYLTMAYIEGQTLAERIRHKTQQQRDTALLLRKIALALAEAHRRGIIHRDLKPANILINLHGEPVIMDFGLARRVDQETERLTKTGELLGTPSYMPPEQVNGDVQAMGPACDIYSLGVILYELLTGRLPFEGPFVGVLSQILVDPPKPPSLHRPDVEPELEAICLKAMAKKPAGRFASMQEFAAALSAYLDRDEATQRGAPAGRDTLPLQASGPMPRVALPPAAEGSRRGFGAVLGGIAVLLLVAAPLAYIGYARLTGTPDAPPPGEAPKPAPTGGLIQIKLDPPDAKVEVQVDDERYKPGQLAEPLRLEPREHRLVVTGDEYEPVRQSFTVKPGANNTPLTVKLTPAQGTIKIAFADRPAPGSVVKVDGAVVDPAQLGKGLQLRLGEHRVEVSSREHETQTRYFIVRRDSNPVVTVPALVPLPGTLTVHLAKPGITAEVHRAGKQQATAKPGTALSLPPGEYDLVINARDFEPYRQRFSISPRANTELAVTLTPKEPPAGERHAWESPNGRIAAMAFNLDGVVLVATHGGTLHQFDADLKEKAKPIDLRTGSSTNVTAVAFSTSGQRALVGTASQQRNAKRVTWSEPSLHLWDLTAKRNLGPLNGVTDRIMTGAIGTDGRHAVTGDFEGKIQFWDLAKRLQVTPFSVARQRANENPRIWGLAFLPNGQVVGSGADRFARLWNPAAGKEVRRYEGSNDERFHSLAVSPDGRWVALGSTDKAQPLRLWDLRTGTETTLKCHKAAVECVAFTPDGRRLFSSDVEGRAHFWDVAAEKEVPGFEKFKGRVHLAAFAPDGRRVLLAMGNSVRLWSLPK
jgi:predicted Ser/Thr protein kinase/sugar lactone lactonase YvrE